MKGIYALEIYLSKDVCLEVGALGEVPFVEGKYVYVGSAQLNLEKRVERHLRRKKKIFWHIDYLLTNKWARTEKVFFREATKSVECALATELARVGQPVVGFGCSDCHCQSHLFRLTKSPSLLERSVFSASLGWSKLGAKGAL